jgi:hypothetical protein
MGNMDEVKIQGDSRLPLVRECLKDDWQQP